MLGVVVDERIGCLILAILRSSPNWIEWMHVVSLEFSRCDAARRQEKLSLSRAPLGLNKKKTRHIRHQIDLLGRIPLILHRLCCFQALYGPSYYCRPSYIIGWYFGRYNMKKNTKSGL
jgi:hypothetical protein